MTNVGFAAPRNWLSVKWLTLLQVMLSFVIRDVLLLHPSKIIVSHVETSMNSWDIYPTWARGYKFVFMLNSVEHEILNIHKYKNIKNFSFFYIQTNRDFF